MLCSASRGIRKYRKAPDHQEEIMPFTGTVMVRNLRRGPTVFDNPEDSRKYFVWGGKDSPDGSDVKPIDAKIANTPEFTAAINRGIFEVIDTHTAQESLAQQLAEYEKRRNAKEEKTSEAIDRDSNRSIDSGTCLGPADRGNGNCGQIVPVSEDEPPLCTKHKHLAPQFVSSEEWVDSRKVVSWSRVSIDR